MNERIGNGSSARSSEAGAPVKLSQWDALLLESLRGLGWSGEELISRVREGSLPVDDSEFEFDYTRLTALEAENPEEFQRAVASGYIIKYNTIRGIRSWIKVALGKEAELELTEGEEFVRVRLDADEAERLKRVLSFGWRLTGSPAAGTPEGGEAEVKIEPVRPA